MIGWVLVGDGVPSKRVGVGGGVSVSGTSVGGVVVLLVSVGGGRMMGVGVTMEGVLDGTGDKTGKGGGAIPQTSQEVKRSAATASTMYLLIL
jgi:hypothetical protein